MVEILCPHCEQEIELDDDASGEFACPHCEGEFEWNIQPEVEQFDEPDSLLLTLVSGFFSGSLLLTGLALLVAIVRFWRSVLVSLVGVFFGSQLSGVESDIGSGTGLGAGVIIFSILVGLFGLALAIAGIGAIRRNFAAFVACAVLSVLGTLGGIGQIIELGFQIDAILGLLFWAAMVTGHSFVLFTPRGRMMWME